MSGLVRRTVLAAGIAAIGTASLAAECRPDRVELRGAFGQTAFTVEIADDDAERAQGLMHRAAMPRFSGMLFVFDRPQRAVFWMENTLIPLDMLFIDNAGVVQRIHSNAVPLDRTAIDGGENIRYVLEINGGLAERLRLTPGIELRSAAIDQAAAAWPCP